MRAGVNPITLRGKDQVTGRPTAISIARMHIKIGGEESKLMPLCIYDDPGTEPKNPEEGNARVKAMMVIDEKQVMDGLYYLFPTGEFDHAPQSAAAVNTALVEGLKIAITAIKGLGGDAKPLEDVLLKAGV
jgi:hypothetical protein